MLFHFYVLCHNRGVTIIHFNKTYFDRTTTWLMAHWWRLGEEVGDKWRERRHKLTKLMAPLSRHHPSWGISLLFHKHGGNESMRVCLGVCVLGLSHLCFVPLPDITELKQKLHVLNLLILLLPEPNRNTLKVNTHSRRLTAYSITWKRNINTHSPVHPSIS